MRPKLVQSDVPSNLSSDNRINRGGWLYASVHDRCDHGIASGHIA